MLGALIGYVLAKPVDPALGDPAASKLRAALQGGDWRAGAAQLESADEHQPRALAESGRNPAPQSANVPDFQRRALLVRAASTFAGRPAWMDAWAEAAPRSATARLVRGAHAINWAWEARGSGGGERVTDAMARLFLGRLELANADLQAAAALAPDDPLPWALRIRAAIGLSRIWEVRQHFAEAVRRDPGNRTAHFLMLMALQERWLGSQAEMMSFANESAARAINPSLHTLIAAAHLEKMIEMDSAAAGTAYLQSDAVGAAVRAAAHRAGVLGAGGASTLDQIEDRNIFACIFWKMGDKENARQQLRALRGRVTEHPWWYFGHQTRAFYAARLAVGG